MGAITPTAAPVTTSLATPSPVPTTLSPGDFANPTIQPITTPPNAGPLLPGDVANPMVNSATTPTGTDLSETDRVTLQYALHLLKAARVGAASTDPATAVAGKRQMQVLASYLIGFCDSRGMIDTAPIKPGFEALFGVEDKPDLDTALNELETSMENAIATGDTRSMKEFKHAVGDACIAIGVALIFL